ncbi:hypothetical protein KY285_008859 [Solanum tuberosum]|nr:hypothetical protein KY284_008858 [Solanum tuberosum]KAH0747202.1 hypothetical protein KY285_008859 [Solanum tuberosum]
MEKQKVLNGRVFDLEILREYGMSTLFDYVSLQSWEHLFEAPAPYLHEPEVREFSYKMELLNDGGIWTTVKKFINKVLVPRSKKRTVASAADLFLMEKLDELKAINLPAIILEHMHRVMTWKNSKHGIPYGYLLNHVFNHFEVPLGRGVLGTIRQMFSPATLLEYECVEGKVKGKSRVSDLLEQQESLKRELNDLTVTLNAKEVEIARLKAQMQQTISKGPGTSSVDKKEVEKLRAENAQLLKTNASLSKEVQSFNKQIIQAHVDANERMTLLLKSFNPSPLRPKYVM